MGGTAFAARVLPAEAHKLLSLMPVKEAPDLSRMVVSPLPGRVTKVLCAVGDKVASGQELCVVEAMKMENKLLAASEGTVKKISIDVGQTVDEGEILVEME